MAGAKNVITAPKVSELKAKAKVEEWYAEAADAASWFLSCLEHGRDWDRAKPSEATSEGTRPFCSCVRNLFAYPAWLLALRRPATRRA